MTKAPPLELSPLFIEGLRKINTLSSEEILEYLEINDDMRWKGWSDNVIEEIKTNGNCKYKPIYCVLVVWHMSKGYSFESFGALIGCGHRTTYRWLDRFPEFFVARDIGMLSRLRQWEDIIEKSATGKSKGNAASLIFALKNYFPETYKDKREIEHSGHIYMVDTGITRDARTPRVIDGEIVELLGDDVTEALEYEENVSESMDDCF